MFLKSVVDLKQLPHDKKPHVAFVGRSNVGKSSLINGLAGQKNLARVSQEPGRTRTLNIYQIEKPYYLIDLPGYGFAKTSKAKQDAFADLIMGYLRESEDLRFVFVVIDARQGATELDKTMIAFLTSEEIPFAIVANKIDKLTRSDAANLMRALAKDYPNVASFPHSALESTHRGEIKEFIRKMVKKE